MTIRKGSFGFTLLETRPAARAARLQPPRGGLALTGFTLIEVVVAVSVFSIMLLIMMGVFSRFIALQRQDVGEFRLQEDVRVALELFNREARLAYGNTFAADNNTLVFRNQNGNCVTYRWNNELFQRAEQTAVSGTCSVIFDDQRFQSLHTPQTIMKNMHFSAIPARVSTDDRLESQGLVTVSINARSRTDAQEILFQNTVSSRQVIPYRPL